MQPKTPEAKLLAAYFNLLSDMGRAGERIWEVSKGIEDIQEKLAYLKYAVSWLRAKAKEDVWEVPPVDFRTFVESRELLDKPGVLWPKVMEAGQEMNSGKYVEAVLTGAIGVAKSTLAIYTQAYQVYVLSCMKNPHAVFDLDPSSEILIVFQSINKNLAMDVDYRRFRSMIDDAPYFQTEFTYNRGRESYMRFDRFNIVVKPVAGHDTAAIGQNVIGGILDELNFMAVVENSKQTRDGSLYDQATQNYNSIARRRESRFMQLGQLPGMLCLVSSRNYPGQFTDKKEEEARRNPRIYIYDKRLWEIRPERFSGEKFQVFIGDQTRKPRILRDIDVIPYEDRHLVMDIPIEYRQTFENDLLAALRDVAGVAVQAMHPFMPNTDAVSACFGRVQSIASREDCDFQDTRVLLYPKRVQHPQEPRFVHVDLALAKDSAGVTVGHVPRFVPVSRGEHTEILPVVQLDMILEVRPPRGGEIEFENIRKLIYTLRDKLRLPVKWVTFDQYQSRDSMQILHREGFMTGYQSMDVDTYAYDVLKQALYDGRVLAPEHPKALKELVTLEIDVKKNKIDHPPHSSKDVADSIAGVVFGLTMRLEIWRRHGIPTYRMPRSISEMKPQSKKSLSYTETLREQRYASVV